MHTISKVWARWSKQILYLSFKRTR